MSFVANARMYAVTPEAEAAWSALLDRVCDMADVELDYVPYPAPQPLENLWQRGDLGAVFMCGYPMASRLADVVPIAAPVPALDWAGGKPLYRSDLIVRRDSRFRTLEDTFGGRTGWTVEHSHSGFNAWRHHLLGFRPPDRPALYREVRGHLVTARRILDSVVAGEIDVGPLDAYWHALIARYRPELTAEIRVVASTDLAPIPAIVASPTLPEKDRDALAAAFVAASSEPWFAPLGEALLLTGFAAVTRADYEPTLRWEREALAAGYAFPA